MMILKDLNWDDTINFLGERGKWCCGAGSNLANVAVGFEGRGPPAMYGQSSGLAFGRNKKPGVVGTVTNKEMGNMLVKAEMDKDTELTEALARSRLFPQDERTRVRLRDNAQAAIVGTLPFISPELLMEMNNDMDFREASMGSCVVTFVESMLRMAATRCRNPREYKREALLKLEGTVMTDDTNFYAWKFDYEQAVMQIAKLLIKS